MSLFKDKKIRPPPKIASNFNAIIMDQENQKANRNPKQSNPEASEPRGRKRFSKGLEEKTS